MRPVFAQPGYIEADTHILLASKRFAYADCFTIRASDGTLLRYTTAQKNVVVMPHDDPDAVLPVTFTSKAVKISGLKTTIGIGVEVDEQDLQLDFGDADTYNGQPFGAAIRRGRLDGATIRRDRFFTQRFGTPYVGGTPMFVGRMSTVDRVGRSSATIKVKSDLVLLNTQMPRKMFQPQCNWTLFDPGCGLERDDYEQFGTAGVGTTASVIVPVGISGVGEFVRGVVQIEDENSFTEIRTIKEVVGGNLVLSYPLDFTPGPGSNFMAYPGCIRTYARCGDYNNQARFQAFEFVPQAETAR